MSIAYDSSAKGNIFEDQTATFNHTCTGSHLYLLVFTDYTTTNVTYNSVAMTRLTNHIITYNGGFNFVPGISVWGLANPATGTNLVSAKGGQAAGSAKSDNIISVSYTGVDPTQPDAYTTNQTAGSGAGSQTDSVNILTDNSWITVFIENIVSPATLSAGASTTLRQTASTSSNGVKGVLDSNGAKSPVGSYSLITNTDNPGPFSSIMYALKPYISYTFSGPASGSVNSASTNFTVTPDAVINGTITITPSGGGLSTPIVLTFSNSSAAQTFTITPTTSGLVTLTPTNGVGINNPAVVSYTANAVVPTTTVIGTAIPDNAKAYVAFTAPSSDGGATITGYTATSTPSSITGTGTTSPITVTGLSNGTPYTFKVKATNSVGDGPESSASNSVTPFVAATSFTFTGPTSGNVRSASSNFTVTPDAVFYGTITITPTGAGSTGLSAVTLTFNGSSAAQTFNITPLMAGAITLTPTNSGTLTNPANIVYTASAVVPLAPTLGYVVPDINAIRVAVVAPTNDGGSAILYYTVTCSNGTVKTLLAAGEVLFDNLTPGTSYTFYASATNSVGTSSNSSTSTGVTPLTTAARFFNNGPKFSIDNSVGNSLSF